MQQQQAEWGEGSGRRTPSQYSQGAPLTEAERKRVDLQMRLWRARYEVATHIPIRIFREPEECVEVQQILDRLQLPGR